MCSAVQPIGVTMLSVCPTDRLSVSDAVNFHCD